MSVPGKPRRNPKGDLRAAGNWTRPLAEGLHLSRTLRVLLRRLLHRLQRCLALAKHRADHASSGTSRDDSSAKHSHFRHSCEAVDLCCRSERAEQPRREPASDEVAVLLGSFCSEVTERSEM